MQAQPNTEVNQLHDKLYRKYRVYDMGWAGHLDLGTHMVAGAPCGGPIAMVRDEHQMLRATAETKPTIQIYTSAGQLLSQFWWENPGTLIQMGWTEKEELVCVVGDGTVLLFNVFGERIAEFSIFPEDSGQQVTECHMWGSGLVVLTRRHQLFSVTDLTEGRFRSTPLAAVGSEELGARAPTAMTIIEPQFTRSNTVEVLLASHTGTILVVSESSCQDQDVRNKGPFTKMAVTPSGKMLACFTESGMLWVCSTDFQKNLTEFNPMAQRPPSQLVWCGVDSVMLYWDISPDRDKLLLMVGPHGDWVKYSYKSPLVLLPECDGVRIVSNDKCEFLHRVPKSTEDVFKLGSLEPAAILHDAMEFFESQSAKADEHIRNIKARAALVGAVDGCIDAAVHEFQPHTQRSLLKAAAYGKCFCDYYNADNFVDNCKTLRVINNLRHPDVGIPITFQQYQKSGADSIVERLVNRHLHFVACRVCEFLRMKPNRVLIHWASCKVRRTLQLPAEIVRDNVVRKMSKCPGISYVEVAQAAHDVGRKELATLILDHEVSPREQIKLLMQMGCNERALVKALQAGDTDWIYLVLLHLMREFGLDPGPRGRQNQDGAKSFVQMIKDKPVACDLFVQYARSQDLKLLLFFFHFTQNNTELARMTIHEAYKQQSAADKAKILKETQVLLAARPAESSFYAKATEEQIKLLGMAELEPLTKGGHAHKPLSEIIQQLIQTGHMNKALKLKSDFKVPDKRFWWLKLKALAAAGKWAELDKFGQEKRSPIGYEPFVQVCLEHGRLLEAKRFCLDKLDKPSVRAEYLIKMEDWEAATEQAVLAKDTKLLKELIPKAKELPNLSSQIQAALQQLE